VALQRAQVRFQQHDVVVGPCGGDEVQVPVPRRVRLRVHETAVQAGDLRGADQRARGGPAAGQVVRGAHDEPLERAGVHGDVLVQVLVVVHRELADPAVQHDGGIVDVAAPGGSVPIFVRARLAQVFLPYAGQV